MDRPIFNLFRYEDVDILDDSGLVLRFEEITITSPLATRSIDIEPGEKFEYADVALDTGDIVFVNRQSDIEEGGYYSSEYFYRFPTNLSNSLRFRYENKEDEY